MIELHGNELPSTVDLADDIFFGNAHIGVVGRSGHDATNSHDRSPFKARSIGRDNDQRDALVLGRLGIGTASQPDIVRLVGTRGVHLVAIDDPLITIEHS